MSVIFCDTETTGLDPDNDEVWEIALIEEDGTEHEWLIKPQRLYDASPDALRITGFYQRWVTAQEGERYLDKFFSDTPRGRIAFEVATLTSGKHLVGAVPSFDANFLQRFLKREGYAPAWHYHLVDVEALVAGRLGIAPPWDTKELSQGMGLDLIDFGQKHTALADAKWAKAMYEAAFDPGTLLRLDGAF